MSVNRLNIHDFLTFKRARRKDNGGPSVNITLVPEDYVEQMFEEVTERQVSPDDFTGRGEIKNFSKLEAACKMLKQGDRITVVRFLYPRSISRWNSHVLYRFYLFPFFRLETFPSTAACLLDSLAPIFVVSGLCVFHRFS